MTYDGFGRLKTVEGPSTGTPAYRAEAKYTYADPKTTGGKDDHLRRCREAHRRRRFSQGLAQALPHLRRPGHGRPGVLRYRERPACRQSPLRRERSARQRVGPTQGRPASSATSPSGSGGTTAASSPLNTYDTLRRPVLVTLPDGETTEHRYDGWSRSLVDQNDRLKRWDSDGLGRLTKVSEYTGSDPSATLYAETRYEYSVADELTKVTDAAGNITTISYDELGRKTSMTDPDMGSWSYSYDAVGNLIEQTDAKARSSSSPTTSSIV